MGSKMDKATVISKRRIGNQKVSQSRVASEKKKENYSYQLSKGRVDVQAEPSKMRLLRLRLRETQAKVARRLGLSPATYQAIERRKRAINTDRLSDIAGYFNVKPDLIFEKAGKGKFLAILVKIV